ncbi:MAG TPA: DUF4097 family beta strand repeat-containing protein [Acidimicrobiia bacterium]|nr:DUF4097 family beta strand repeat-containing protein [Acidimicrobiia bacterium]
MPTFQTPEPITVSLELGVAEVQLTASDRNDTVVEIHPTNPQSKADIAAAQQVTVEFVDGQLRIATARGWRHWVPRGGRHSVDVRIELPTGSHVNGSVGIAALQCEGRIGDCRYKAGLGKVRIDRGSSVSLSVGAGNIDVEHASGRVDVKTTGTVRLGTIDGSAVVKNSNGDTSIRAINGELRVTSANGDIAVEHAHGNVVAKSANGDIALTAIERGAVAANTARGKIEIGIRDGVAAWLDLSTAMGTVRNDLDAAQKPAPGDAAVEVRARTAMGDITIRRALPVI